MYNTVTTPQFVKRDNSIQQASTSTPLSMVIVERNPTARAALSKAFSAEGIRVVSNIAESQSTLQVACTLDPDLILYSVNSPEIDELQRIMILRRELPNTLILVLVHGELNGQEKIITDYGAHQVLSNSIHPTELVKAVQALMHAHLPSILFTAQSLTRAQFSQAADVSL